MKKLTLTKAQIPQAREMVAWLHGDGEDEPYGFSDTPGYREWFDDECSDASDDRWADALEAAIAEAEGEDADPRQPGPVSDGDERAFWREACLRGLSPGFPADQATKAADCADEALARYRKAFCAGMSSQKKGSES